MRYTTTIKLSNDDIKLVLSGGPPLLDFFNGHKQIIHDLLVEYWFRRRGAVDSLSLLLDSLSFDGTRNGMLQVHYKVLFSFACEDRSSLQREKMILDFTVRLDDREMVVSGEDERERVDEL
jgi:hypothetical protein